MSKYTVKYITRYKNKEKNKENLVIPPTVKSGNNSDTFDPSFAKEI